MLILDALYVKINVYVKLTAFWSKNHIISWEKIDFGNLLSVVTVMIQ